MTINIMLNVVSVWPGLGLGVCIAIGLSFNDILPCAGKHVIVNDIMLCAQQYVNDYFTFTTCPDFFFFFCIYHIKDTYQQ